MNTANSEGNMKKRTYCRVHLLLFWVLLLPLSGYGAGAERGITDTMEKIVARMTAALSQEQLLQLDERTLAPFITAEDRQVLATKYWCFDANVPVVVSVMHDVKQPTTPFWLSEAGFQKTALKVKNEEFEYEVWRKPFNAGRIGLGINGFDKHRPHYFVAVGPQQAGTKVQLSNFYPSDQKVFEMKKGATIYHDWSDLLLTEVPDELNGQILLPTIRGRAREAQFFGAFRKTPYPSSAKPDEVTLTWSEDPRTTQTVQWRTNPSVAEGLVRYKEKSAPPDGAWSDAKATCATLKDGFLWNDPSIHHFTGTLRDLKPATTYLYTVGGPAEDQRLGPYEFITGPDKPAPFSFIFMSDTHNSPESGNLTSLAVKRHPELSFCTISGDLVGTGQYRDDWDKLLNLSSDLLRQRALVPVIGNHDAIDGLGADLYLTLFGLPTNGPKQLQPERAYSLQYGNTLFLILDVTAVVEDQTKWLEEQLAHSTATWKFAIFHFPPYAPNDDNPDILREWVPLFDKYHVDVVLSGHVHSYLRTYPLKGGKRMSSSSDGTVYLVSVSVPRGNEKPPQADYLEMVDTTKVPLYVLFTIDGNRLVSRAYDAENKVHDEFVLQK